MFWDKYVTRFAQEMKLKNYADRTIDVYTSIVKDFLLVHSEANRPREVTEGQIKDYLRASSSVAQLRQRIGAIKAFYKYVVKQPCKFKYIEYPRKERKLPIVLDLSEVAAILKVCENIKHKAIIATLYSTGVRVSELLDLAISDIDSKRMLIYVRGGKGNKDRQVPLDAKVLDLLRSYYKAYKPSKYLFEGQGGGRYTSRSISAILKANGAKAGVGKRVYPHLCRHSYLTHLVEQGTDISVAQKIAGHRSLNTTRLYTHISSSLIARTPNPVNLML
jgi:site-specific recombinase XerD